MARWRSLIRITALTILFAFPASLYGWHAAGHGVISSICYREMTPARRTTIADILRKHPRFEEDFMAKMPEDVRNGDEKTQAEWLFQRESTWSDSVRSGPPERRAHDRPLWHYVNVPHFLTGDDFKAMSKDAKVNLETAPPADDFDDKQMNIVQAINNSTRILRDSKTD